MVILAILDCAGKGGWRGTDRFSEEICTCGLPSIEGKDPLEVWSLVEKLRGIMYEALRGVNFLRLFGKYINCGFLDDEYEKSQLEEAGFRLYIYGQPIYYCIQRVKAVRELEALLAQRWEWFVKEHSREAGIWNKCSTLIRYYILGRAADFLSFGES